MIGKYDDLYSFFHRPWCPLFGSLPDDGYHEHDEIYQFSQVIRENRYIWGLLYNSALTPTEDGDNWPTIEEAVEELVYTYGNHPPFPYGWITAARRIYAGTRCILQYVAVDDHDRPLENRAISVKSAKWIAYIARDCIENVPDELPDIYIISLLSIDRAQDALDDLVAGREKSAGLHAFEANKLLNLAQSIKNDKAVTALRREAEENKKGAKQCKKQSSGLVNSNRQSNFEAGERNRILSVWIEDIRGKKGGSKTAIFKNILKKIKTKDYPDFLSPEDICKIECKPIKIGTFRNNF